MFLNKKCCSIYSDEQATKTTVVIIFFNKRHCHLLTWQPEYWCLVIFVDLSTGQQGSFDLYVKAFNNAKKKIKHARNVCYHLLSFSMTLYNNAPLPPNNVFVI